MPQPQAYERQTDFTERDGDDTDHAALNQELDAAALSIEGIRDNLALIQNDDGGLKNAVVTPESLAPETFTALQGDVAGAVAEAEAAAQSALTSATTANTARDQAVAAAAAAQTSQTAAALNAGTASTAAGAASASQTAAAASAAAALVSENNASDSEDAALISQNAAAASAAAALSDKNAAAVSAAAALVSANNADVSEAAALVSQTAASGSAVAAGASQVAAAASQVAAAASAASTNLPVSLVGKLLNFLRVKADESGYETRTPAQALLDIGGVYRGHISGLSLSNNVTDATNDIDVASGTAVDDTTTYLMSLTGPFTKRLDAAWAVGTGNGGLDTGSIANAEYHVWLIRKDSDGTIDALFSLSATAPTMPTGYTAKRRIGSIFRASAAIRLFIQKGDRVYYKTPPLDVDTTIGTTATSYTLSVPGGCVAIINAFGSKSGNTLGVYIYSPDITDQAHSEAASPLSNFSSAVGGATSVYLTAQIEVLANASSQIRAVGQVASTSFKVATVGYIDSRGKDA